MSRDAGTEAVIRRSPMGARNPNTLRGLTMSEPHELEERATEMVRDGIARDWMDPAAIARTVLDLVRQEQEKWDLQIAFLQWLNGLTDNPGDTWNEGVWETMIRAWWLSHTAKETSNG